MELNTKTYTSRTISPKSSKEQCIAFIFKNGASEKTEQSPRKTCQRGQPVQPRHRLNKSIPDKVKKRTIKRYSESKPIAKQINYMGIEWYDGEYDKSDITPYLYIDGILYDCDYDDAVELDTIRKPFEINGTGSYYVIKRKFGYELFAIEPVNQMEIEDFKKDLKCPMIRDALGNTVKKIESCGYAVLITKNEYRQVNNGRI